MVFLKKKKYLPTSFSGYPIHHHYISTALRSGVAQRHKETKSAVLVEMAVGWDLGGSEASMAPPHRPKSK
jgi:hypothetical protein